MRSNAQLRCTLLLAAAGLLTVSAVFPPRAVRADLEPEAQSLLGSPDNASAAPNNREHFLIRRPQYTLSYNDALRFPNWVAWHLNAADLGSVARGQFQPDPALPRGFAQVTPADYTRSGYDRGHNCPSADRSATPTDNDAVFLMTNMTPQAHGLNAGPWERLESYCRDLARGGNELYIICGHGFSAPTHQTIGRNQVAVPDFGWKVVVVLPDQSGDDLRRIDAGTRVIAVRMPNVNTVSHENWTRYLSTPADIEKGTGLKFFTALPPTLAQTLRAKLDAGGGDTARSRAGSRSGGRGTANAPADRAATASANGTATSAAGQVWVNTRSGVYWRPGTQYYGKTKQGRYMSEADAVNAGYHAAGGQK